MSTAITRAYWKERDHQRKVQVTGGGMLTTYPSGRTELSYGSAPYGEHAISAWAAARRHVAFVQRLEGYCSARGAGRD